MQALARAARRGVKVRVYLDGAELSKDEEQVPFSELAATPGVEMRVKRDSALMHLKSYAIDANALRTGAANFSASPFPSIPI
jgi:phosphatidylserine/phosphatidylglycerophosphate/cardiolipin synthase-like enzyme